MLSAVDAGPSLTAAGGFPWCTLGAPAWSQQLSPFAHLAPVPAAGPDWAGTAGMLAVAATAVVIGLSTYRRRVLRIS